MLNIQGLPRWHSGEESACQCGRHGFDPWVRKIPWSRKWQPTPVFLPGKLHGPGKIQTMGSQRVGHKYTSRKLYIQCNYKYMWCHYLPHFKCSYWKVNSFSSLIWAINSPSLLAASESVLSFFILEINSWSPSSKDQLQYSRITMWWHPKAQKSASHRRIRPGSKNLGKTAIL